MCITAATAALISAGVGGASLVNTLEQQRQGRSQSRQAGRDAAAAEARAAQSSNERLAIRRRALAANSLATGSGAGYGDMGSGRVTLGGG